MFRKILCSALSLGLCVCLCGCNIFTADTAELLSPPALTGDLLPIDEAIRASIKTDYTPEYPSRGNYRSAVILEDIDKNGVLEAFAFYSTQGTETTQMNINAVKNEGGKWRSVAVSTLPAGGVDRVEFCDLDRDGVSEILVGWEIYGEAELQLGVYSLKKNKFSNILMEQYSHFVTCDLNDDGQNEIMIVRSSPTENKNTAHLFAVADNNGFKEITSCRLDSTAKTLNHPVVSTLSTGAPAVYIDEIKGVGAITEVLYLEKGALINPLLDGSGKENTKTLRTATLDCRDVNRDGILEIPVRREVPTVNLVSDSEKQYLTDWCSFNGESLTVQLTALVNLSDGYMYSIPKKLMGNIAVLRDTENSLTEIYSYNAKKNTVGERLIYFKAVPKKEWDKGTYKSEDLWEIVNNGETSYLCSLSVGAGKLEITADKIKNDFWSDIN